VHGRPSARTTTARAPGTEIGTPVVHFALSHAVGVAVEIEQRVGVTQSQR
jgi:hypothetical protein